MKKFNSMYYWLGWLGIIAIVNFYFLLFNPILSMLFFKILPFSILLNPLILWLFNFLILLNICGTFMMFKDYLLNKSLEFFLYPKLLLLIVRNFFLLLLRMAFIFSFMILSMLLLSSLYHNKVICISLLISISWVFIALCRACFDISCQEECSWQQDLRYWLSILGDVKNQVMLILYSYCALFIFLTFFKLLFPVSCSLTLLIYYEHIQYSKEKRKKLENQK